MKKCFLLLLATSLFSAEVPVEEEPDEPAPWFTGSLLAPLGEAVPYGHFEIDFYNLLTIETGEYNKNWKVDDIPNFYSYTPQFYCYFGLTSWMDIQIIPQIAANWTQGKSSVGFGDFYTALDIQFYSSENEGWFPGILFSIGELFPTGKYQRLDPNKLGTDQTGFGSFVTYFSLILFKVYHIYDNHFLSFTLTGECGLTSTTSVHGFNAYGGGFDTNGHVNPGDTLTAICSFEYSLSQNWGLALDTYWNHENLTWFSGDPGVDEDGLPAEVGFPSSDTLSFAPAIEYGFSENCGIVGGCWFSAIGRNSAEFRNAVVNLYYYY
jgi:hypothetical protein